MSSGTCAHSVTWSKTNRCQLFADQPEVAIWNRALPVPDRANRGRIRVSFDAPWKFYPGFCKKEGRGTQGKAPDCSHI